MANVKLDNVEQTMLRALQHKDRASLKEVAAMLPEEGQGRLAAARAKLEQKKLVEPVPGSTTGQMQLTAQGAELANGLGPADTIGSGGGDSKFV